MQPLSASLTACRTGSEDALPPVMELITVLIINAVRRKLLIVGETITPACRLSRAQ